MSIEIARQDYSFRPDNYWSRREKARERTSESEQASESVDDNDDNDAASNFSDPPDLPSPYPPFFYRPLHDMESMLWLLLYVLFRWLREEPQDAEDAEEARRRAAQDNMFNEMFIGSKWYDRRSILVDGVAFCSALRVLPPRLQRAGRILEKWRKQLVSCYTASEQTYDSVATHVFDGLHAGCAETIRNMCKIILREDDDKAPAGESRKRSIAEVDDAVDKKAEDASIPPAKRTRS